jgi:hypothetical protein
MKHFTKLLFLFAIILTIFSCKKEYNQINTSADISEYDKFFNLPADAPSVLIRIAEKLKKQNEENPFIANFIKEEGYPLWAHAQIKVTPKKKDTRHFHGTDSSTNSDTLVFIPLAKEQEEFVKGFISCIVQTDILFKLFEGEKFAEYGFDKSENRTAPNADDVAAKIIEFDKNIYGYNYVLITDKRLFDYWDPNLEKPNQFILDLSKSPQPSTFTTQVSFPCGYAPVSGPTGGDPVGGWGYTEVWCTIIFEWQYTDAGGGGGYTPVLSGVTFIPPTDPHGGGDGSTPPKAGDINYGWQVPLCGVMRLTNTTLKYNGGCSQITIENQTFFSIKQFNVDQVSNPCLLDIIENEIGETGCSQYLLKLFQQWNDPSHANQLKFKFSVNDILTQDDGVTPTISRTFFDTDPITGITTAYIKFNGPLLQNASKEFLATIILHELSHVFIYIKNPSVSVLQSHKNIFEEYVDDIALSAHELYPQLSAVDATAMALQGMDDYYLLPGTLDIDPLKNSYCLATYGMSLLYARSIGLEYLNSSKGTRCE